jgi:hypothetical protein
LLLLAGVFVAGLFPGKRLLYLMSSATISRPKDLRRSKYELMHTVRVHLGCEDDAFGCMGNGEDADGIKGVFLRRNVVNVAGRSLKINLQRLGPLVLPFSEIVRPSLPWLPWGRKHVHEHEKIL